MILKRVAILSFIIPAFLLGQNEKAELSHLGFDQIEVVGFTLERNRVVQIEGIGAGGDKEIKKGRLSLQVDPFNLFAYAWIIDANTRKMVWRMTIDESSGDWWNKSNREFNVKADLPEGDYELYFSSVKPTSQSGFMTLGRLFEKMFGDDDWEEYSRDWFVRVSNVDAVLSDDAVSKYWRAFKENALISLSKAGDRAYLSRGFSVEKPIKVEIYALGEGHDGEMFDYAWLVDANSRKKIWQMKYNQTDHAGGTIKNRIVRKRITLDKGNYILYYKTDDNHSSEEWNANPPYDPEFWGVTIFAADKNLDRSVIKDFREDVQQPVIEIVRMGDSAYREEGLVVEKTGTFRIYAIGEGSNGKMADYGWITNATTGNQVWKMDYYDTEHAGGASKNRLIDEVIKLDKGNYIVHYRTDGSHSYEDWNSSRPREPEKWGITIYPVGNNSAAKKIESSDLKSKDIIAQLTRVGDDEHVRRRFTINKKTRVRIYAIGEGDWDELYDYGWITNEKTGRKVWRMRYRNTDPAGGAKKNRVVDTIVTLEPGTYTVHYTSDDSHSYRDWNASPPDNQEFWGITLYHVGN